MQDIHASLAALRRVLTNLVIGGLVLSWFVPGFFEGAARVKAVEFVLFLHVFLPVWGWGCFNYMRNQWSALEEEEAPARVRRD